MSLKQLSTAVIAIAFGSCAFISQASNGASNSPAANHPTNNYWQAPSWSGFTAPPSYNNNYRRPVAPPAYRQPPANYQRQNANRTAPPPPARPYRGSPAPGANPYRGAPPGNMNRGPRGPYSGPSAFNTPGYNPNRYNRRNNSRWGSNKFWGRSGPSKWMNPSKDNWENSWDDMINAPSRMGEMPGGWTAPEVTVPNPIDMGDQVQDNLQDLPDQMRDGNIGNDVSN